MKDGAEDKAREQMLLRARAHLTRQLGQAAREDMGDAFSAAPPPRPRLLAHDAPVAAPLFGTPDLFGASEPAGARSALDGRGRRVSSGVRERVTEAAASLFVRRGVRSVQLEEVAQSAGLTAAQLSEVALSREDLLYQTVKSQVERMVAEAQVYLAPDVPLPAMLEGLSTSTFAYVLQHPLVMQVLLGMLEVGPAWTERFAELRRRCLEPVARALRVGIQQGVLREDLEVEWAASILFELHVAGYLAPRTGPEARERAEKRREVALDLVLRGMLRQGE